MNNDYTQQDINQIEETKKLEQKIKAYEKALSNLLYPNVPSADDFRMLIIGVGGSSETVEKAMELADKLEEAQQQARILLER